MRHDYRAYASLDGKKIFITFDVSYEEPVYGGTTTQSGATFEIPPAEAEALLPSLTKAINDAKARRDIIRDDEIEQLEARLRELRS